MSSQTGVNGKKTKRMKIRRNCTKLARNKNETKQVRDKTPVWIEEKPDVPFLTPSKSDSETVLDDEFEEELSDDNEPDVFENINGTACNSKCAYTSIVEEFIDEEPLNKEDCMINSSPFSLITDAKYKYLKKRKRNVENIECNGIDSPHIELASGNQDRTSEPACSTLNDSSLLENNYGTSEDCTSRITDNYSFFNHPNGKLVVINKNKSVYFHGVMSLKVVYGEIEILGYTLNKDSQNFKLYSPRGTGLLYLKNTHKAENDGDDFIYNLVSDFGNLDNLQVNLQCSIVICYRMEDKRLAFIEKHISQQILPKIDGHLPRSIIDPIGNLNLITTNDHWNDIVDKIDELSKALICGGKSVGKSILLRYMVNKLLMRYQEVRVIDLDPGQSEFTPPGCVSIITITEPLFGPNYTHFKDPDRSILSNINIAYEPEQYVARVKSLLTGFNANKQVPTLINYMGYTHGIGINIVSAVIIHIKPTDLLQIDSQSSKKNFKLKLTQDVVEAHSKLLLPDVECIINYNYHYVQSMSDTSDGWTLESRQMREMCILSYFGQIVNPQTNSIFDVLTPLYEIDLSSIQIINSNGDLLSPAAVNANLVSLCSLEEANIFQCYGWGIVRGIDLICDKLVLLTPVAPEILDKIYYLVFNGVLLPPSIYMTSDNVIGEIPYVIAGELSTFGQLTKRTHLPAKKQ